MGFKRSAKAGDFKKALEMLENNEGFVEGTPNSIMFTLGFDGSWKEFKTQINAKVIKTNLGRYVVMQSSVEKKPQTAQKVEINVDVNLFATCASAYILGYGNEADFEDYTGEYENLDQLTASLALEIDDSIAGLYLPYKTDETIEIYSLERGLFYNAGGDGLFTVYGASILAQI